jgi:hypothetical protein
VAVPAAAADHYRTQQQIGAIAAGTANRLWARVGDDFDAGWNQVREPLLDIVTTAQTAAARTSIAYLADVIYETGQVDLPVGDVQPASFAGTASDGRDLETLLYGGVTTAKTAVGNGQHVAAALGQGGRWLTMTVLTAVADANREASSAGIAMRPAVGGYVRMLNPPSCQRCIILAGKFFRWNSGFQRHPRCDCRHIPASENVAGDFRTDPYALFKSMSPAEQEKVFGRIEARAIRDGGDIYRVVNTSQRGLGTARGARLYGTPDRMTVDDIYRVAGTRTNAIKLMTEHGYITGPQVVGGNIVGAREGFGALGRGGTRRAASDAVEQARLTGVRDQLNRYTMTAAERRVYDAAFRASEAERGYWVRSIGENSADKFTKLAPITPEQRQLVQLELQYQLRALPSQPAEVQQLARRLGLI